MYLTKDHLSVQSTEIVLAVVILNNMKFQLFDKLMIQNNLNAINCYFELVLLRDGNEIGKLMGIAPINSSSQIMENAPGSQKYYEY